VFAMMAPGGQARVLVDAALEAGIEIAGLLDDSERTEYFGIPVMGPLDAWREHLDAGFILGIHARQRLEVGQSILSAGARVLTVVHPRAYVSPRASVGLGVGIMHGVTVHPDARIEDYAIVNANASIDHDCLLEVGAQIGPGVTFPGGVIVRRFASVGAGVVARPGVTIGEGATVGAGAVLTKDVPAGETWAGNPARALGAR
jgi:sugar O-acyltransferase (sialic acid O-acetyltransferase NeuD family)